MMVTTRRSSGGTDKNDKSATEATIEVDTVLVVEATMEVDAVDPVLSVEASMEVETLPHTEASTEAATEMETVTSDIPEVTDELITLVTDTSRGDTEADTDDSNET